MARVAERQLALCDCEWGAAIGGVENMDEANPWHTRSRKTCPSAPELVFWRLLEASTLPMPVREHRFHSERKFRFDFAWPEYMLAAEVEGGNWQGGRHARGGGMDVDMTKYNLAAQDGWRVLRYSPGMFKKDAPGVVAQVRAMLMGASGYAAETTGVVDAPPAPTPLTLSDYLAWYASKPVPPDNKALPCMAA